MCDPASSAQQAIPTVPPSRPVLAFLLRLTDPREQFVIEKEVANEPESHILGPTKNTIFTEINLNRYIDPTLLFTTLLDPYVDTEPNFDMPGHDIPWGPKNSDELGLRITQLSSELERFALMNSEFTDFSRASFDELFTSSHVHQRTSIFSRKRHFQLPIIHWPTFVVERAALPLLLAVSLAGAMYSTSPTDSMGDYRRVSDAFIFSCLGKCMRTSSADGAEVVEHLQAALIAVFFNVNDNEMRPTVIGHRLPALISALRDSNALGASHHGVETWDDFVLCESRVRLATWTFFVDCLTTVFCNKPPMINIPEMGGHLPCSSGLWEAASTIEFRAHFAKETEIGWIQLSDVTIRFLEEDWPVNLGLYERLSLYHLNAIICGKIPLCQSKIYRNVADALSLPAFYL